MVKMGGEMRWIGKRKIRRKREMERNKMTKKEREKGNVWMLANQGGVVIK